MPAKVKPPARKRTGPKPKPESERSRSVNTTLPPEVYAYAAQVGDGSASRGLRMIAAAAESTRAEPPGN